jgi:hypothetical protein
LPLIRLAERAPNLNIFQQLISQTYLKIDEHVYSCIWMVKIPSNPLQSAIVHAPGCNGPWGTFENLTTLTFRFKPEYQFPIWRKTLGGCTNKGKYKSEELFVMTGLSASRAWRVSDLSERLQEEPWEDGPLSNELVQRRRVKTCTQVSRGQTTDLEKIKSAIEYSWHKE